MKDKIVEEIRRIRDVHAARFNYDLDAIAADLREGERAARKKLVSFKPRKLAKRPTNSA